MDAREVLIPDNRGQFDVKGQSKLVRKISVSANVWNIGGGAYEPTSS
jgi:hypothetical protein